jgi:hypothetical protein
MHPRLASQDGREKTALTFVDKIAIYLAQKVRTERRYVRLWDRKNHSFRDSTFVRNDCELKN